MAGTRSFRPAFFGRAGVRVMEDKKALENLLKDDVICKEKLANYCSFHPLPAMYRILIWKMLLGILPVHQQSHKFVICQRCEQFEDLRHALKVMKCIDEKTNLPHVYLRAYILEIGQYSFYHSRERWHDLFWDIAESVCKITDDSVDGYWLSVGIYRKFSEYFGKEEMEFEFRTTFSDVLKKENAKLHEHLSKTQSLPSLPYTKWFSCCYAGTLLPDGGLERVWDVVLGGFFEFLPYVAVQIVMSHERKLFHAEDVSFLLEVLDDVPYPEETGEVIACKAVDLWQRYSEKTG